MRNWIIKLLRNSPASSGFVLLLIALHFSGAKPLQMPLIEKKEIVICFFAYFCIMTAWLFIMPKVDQNKREKATWTIVGSSVLVLTILAKVFIA